METLFNPTGLAALVTALGTGVGGTWLTFRQFHVNRAKTAHDIEASLRAELRSDIEKYRQDTEELRNKVTSLFEENLELKHKLANITQQNIALSASIAKLQAREGPKQTTEGKRSRKKKSNGKQETK